MENLVQFEEDFNSGTKKWVGSRDRLCQTSPIPRSPDGDKNVVAKKTLDLLNDFDDIAIGGDTNLL